LQRGVSRGRAERKFTGTGPPAARRKLVLISTFQRLGQSVETATLLSRPAFALGHSAALPL